MQQAKNSCIDGKEKDRWLIVASILSAASSAIKLFFNGK